MQLEIKQMNGGAACDQASRERDHGLLIGKETHLLDSVQQKH